MTFVPFPQFMHCFSRPRYKTLSRLNSNPWITCLLVRRTRNEVLPQAQVSTSVILSSLSIASFPFLLFLLHVPSSLSNVVTEACLCPLFEKNCGFFGCPFNRLISSRNWRISSCCSVYACNKNSMTFFASARVVILSISILGSFIRTYYPIPL